MISAKIEKLVNSGIDISGYHDLEFEFYVVGKHKLPALEAEFYHPDNSMRVSARKHVNGFGYVLRLLIDGIVSVNFIVGMAGIDRLISQRTTKICKLSTYFHYIMI